MKFALSWAWYFIQFLRLVLSAFIVGFGYLAILDVGRHIKKGLWYEMVVMLFIFGFLIIAFKACNKLVDAIEDFKKRIYFTEKNKQTFQFCAFTIIGYLVFKYGLILLVITIEKGKLALTDWWNDEAIQPTEIISLILLGSFFMIISKLIEEGMLYKDENDLTI